MWIRRSCAVAALCLAMLGCGKSGPNVVEISGRLTRNGQPVPNLFVTFLPDTGRPSFGQADAQGEFKLIYDADHEGAVVGTHSVSVVYRPSSMAEEMGQTTTKHHPDEAAITEKYSAASSPLRIEVRVAQDDLEIKLD